MCIPDKDETSSIVNIPTLKIPLILLEQINNDLLYQFINWC